MFKTTYGAGKKAGISEVMKFTHRADGTKTIADPECPFSHWRFIRRALWFAGYFDGRIERLSQPLRRA